jgi:hypothetical protein
VAFVVGAKLTGPLRSRRAPHGLAMGGWFSSFFAEVAKVFGEAKSMRFLMVGLDNAGKTTILYAMKCEGRCVHGAAWG